MTRKKPSAAAAPRQGFWRGLVWWCATGSALLLSACGLSTFVTPLRFPPLGVFVLTFPVWLAAATLFTLLATALRTRRWWVPLVLLLLNAWAVRVYLPVNLPQEEPKGALTVLSYNTQNYAYHLHDDSAKVALTRYIADSGADIVCLQEAVRHDAYYRRTYLPILAERYAYSDSLEAEGSSFLNIYSRLPIVGRELVADGRGNKCMAFTLLDGADTLYVVNCHLRSMGLSLEEKAGFAGLVHDADTLTTGQKRRESALLFTKIAAASVERAAQADRLCQYLERRRGQRVILCGDFNDTPISYAHNRVASYLTDAYATTATGFGRSFNANSMLVRIDHMFCSEHYRPHACRVDQSVLYSDHYPIRCAFERR
ncbi:MAG: endonuclease/exonuclease/phosphatase family protein [Bacteroidaceae bacterium]|nr:endonuclease/exonuclease/phosphatase family protein [Bacteroidaceae bacterium]